MHPARLHRRRHQPFDAPAFVQSESTFAYFNATQRYLEQHGKPVAFYTDKHAVFRVNKPSGLHGNGMTQFGRALKALSIEIICANSSQAKGRVERANKTLQDRLVKELRLAGVSTMDEGNVFLPAFMADYNARFAKAPFNDKDLHRPMQPRDRLDEAFTWRAERTLSQSLTLQYDNILFMIESSEFAQAAIGRRVEVVDFPDVMSLVKSAASARHVRLLDTRYRNSAPPHLRDANEVGPEVRIHVDHTDQSGLKMVVSAWPDEENLLRTRIRIVNAWMPIGRPVTSAPLALCDASTVEEEDLAVVKILYGNREAQDLEAYSLYHTPSHQWYVVSQLHPTGVLLIKNYDSNRKIKSRFTPHAAIANGELSSNLEVRQSLELKLALFG